MILVTQKPMHTHTGPKWKLQTEPLLVKLRKIIVKQHHIRRDPNAMVLIITVKKPIVEQKSNSSTNC